MGLFAALAVEAPSSFAAPPDVTVSVQSASISASASAVFSGNGVPNTDDRSFGPGDFPNASGSFEVAAGQFDSGGLPGTQGTSANSSARVSVSRSTSADEFSLTVVVETRANTSCFFFDEQPGASANASASSALFVEFQVDTEVEFEFEVEAISFASKSDTTPGSPPSSSGSMVLALAESTVAAVSVQGAEDTEVVETGRLSPGLTYSLQADLSADGMAISDCTPSAGKGAGSTFFVRLSLRPVSDTVRWINLAGGSFDVDENWDPQRVPGVDDVALFDLSLPALTAARRLLPAPALTTPVEPCYSVVTSLARTKRTLVRNCVVGMQGGSLEVSAGNQASPQEPSLGVGSAATLQLTSGSLETLHTIVGDSGFTTDEPSTMNVFNEGTTWTEQGRLTVAEQSPGRLFVANRAFVQANETVIGSLDVAEVIVGGEAFMAMGDLIVGSSEIGEGSVIVEERGSIESFAATLGRRKGGRGSVTLSGSASGPSLWTCQGRLVVGSEGEGTLTIEGGSKVDVLGDVIVGALADGTGRVIVTGEDADGSPSSLLLANTRELVVGEFILEELRGKATLEVVDGGVVAGPLVETEPGKKEFTAFSGLRIGKVASDHGAVAVRGRGESGSSRLFVEEISVAEGDLFIESGGFVRTARLVVGGSTGRVRIAKSDGGEALDVTTDVTIAAGTVSVAESAMLVGRDFFVGLLENDSSAFLAVIGDAPNSLARVTVGDQMQVGNFERGANAVVLMDGGAIFQIGGALFVERGSRFIGRGTVVVPAAVIDGTVSSRVTVISASELRSDGAPPAHATIDSPLEFDGNVELGSTAVVALFVEGGGQFAPLVVTGDLALDGTLEVQVAEGYLPKAGDALGVIEVGGVLTGSFAELRVRGVGEGFEFSFDPETGAVTAENDAVPCEAGDEDGDGILDCPAVASCCGDPTGDGQVTAQDALAVLLGAVGQQACAECCCDVDSSGGVTATDALRVLRAAVGELVPLDCPVCS